MKSLDLRIDQLHITVTVEETESDEAPAAIPDAGELGPKWFVPKAAATAGPTTSAPPPLKHPLIHELWQGLAPLLQKLLQSELSRVLNVPSGSAPSSN